MHNETADAVVRKSTEHLIAALRREHPEQEYEPEGLRLPDEPAEVDRPPPRKRSPRRRIRLKVQGPRSAPTVIAPIGEIPRHEVLRTAIEEAADTYGVDKRLLISRTRQKAVVAARAHAYTTLRRHGWSLSAVARAFKRDRSTVHHAVLRHA